MNKLINLSIFLLTLLFLSACVSKEAIRSEIRDELEKTYSIKLQKAINELEPKVEYIDRNICVDLGGHMVKTYGDITINGYKLYNKTYGLCEAEFETVFYENETHLWKVGFSGCNSDGEYSDYYYLLIDRVYMPIELAIKDEYITLEEFEKSNLGKKIEK